MVNLPARIEYTRPGDYQTIARFLSDAEIGESRTIAVTEHEKAVFIRGGRASDRFSGDSKPVPWDAQVAVGDFRMRHLVIGFGDPELIPYHHGPSTETHATAPRVVTSDGEEIRGMIMVLTLALDRDDRASVQKLLQLREGDRVTVQALADDLPGLPQAVSAPVTTFPATQGQSYIRQDRERLDLIKAEAMGRVRQMLEPYGMTIHDLTLVVGATSRDTEQGLPEADREGRAELEREIARDERKYDRLVNQIRSTERELELAQLEDKIDDLNEKRYHNRLKNLLEATEILGSIQSARERLDPAIGQAGGGNGGPARPGGSYGNGTSQPPAVVTAEPRSEEQRKYDNQALLVAAETGDAAEVVGLLRSGADIETTDLDGRTPLHLAATDGHAMVVRRLIELGANAVLRDKDGRSALHLAMVNGHPELAPMLVKAGREQGGNFIDTTLHEMARKGKTEAARDLIAAGARIDAPEGKGARPLFFAAESGHIEIVRLLISKGADVDAKAEGHASQTALHRAAENGRAEVVSALLDAGAELLPRTAPGTGLLTPIDLARKDGRSEVVRLLTEAREKARTAKEPTPRGGPSTENSWTSLAEQVNSEAKRVEAATEQLRRRRSFVGASWRPALTWTIVLAIAGAAVAAFFYFV